MKNIAVLVYDTSAFGGAERVAANLANEFSKDFNVFLISCFNENKREAFELKSSIKKFVLSEDMKSMTLYCFQLSKRLHRILKENKIDAVLNITAGVNTISYLAAKGLPTKVLYCEHSNLVNKTYGKKHELRQLIGAKTADMVVALTESDKIEFERKYGIEGKVCFIYNWYDGVKSFEYDENSRKIISVGRLEYIKGYDRMVKAAKIVLDRYPDWVWDIYGEGKYFDRINADIEENGLQGRMNLKGNDPNVINKYGEYAFCVMTSYYEGFALALVESMANSVPAVSFDCPTGPREIIDDGVNGFLIEDGNIEDLAEKICTLIENRELRKSFSEKSCAVIEKFSKEKIYKQWLELINSL